MKILYHSPIPADATSFYRGYGPIRHLAEHHTLDEFVPIKNIAEVDWHVLCDADVLFMQRPSCHPELNIIRLAKRCGVPVWIDYDDNYLHVHGPREHIYTIQRIECVRSAMDLADAISVSTFALKLLLEKEGYGEKVHLIPNAMDETLLKFSSERPEAKPVIFWRGGDTHDENFDPYINKLSLLYYNFPHTEWVFLGVPPKKFLNRIDNSRVRLYEWTDLFSYFNLLYEINPTLTLVPWHDDEFTRCRSNSSWIESTMAGSVTVFPSWSSEFVVGMVPYKDENDFFAVVRQVLNNPEDQGAYLKNSRDRVESAFLLKKVNPLRYKLIEQLFNQRRQPLPVNLPVKGRLTLSKQLSFLHEYGYIQEEDSYVAHVRQTGDYLLGKILPISVMEIGCSSGALLEYFLDKKVPQVIGIETNSLLAEYFMERNPYYREAFQVMEDDDPLPALDGVFDLGISIEAFQKISMDRLEPMMKILADHFKFFYFSSSPYHIGQAFDVPHNNINIQPSVFWLNLFNKHGWELIENPMKISRWDYLFKSTRV